MSVLRALVRIVLLKPQQNKTRSSSLAEGVRSGVSKFFEALEVGAKNAIPVSGACAIAGIVVGVIGLTGSRLKFFSPMISFSGGNLVLAIVLVVLASLVLGLPVTAGYIVLAVLTAPALQSEFGVPLIIAHLLIFWYSQDSNVTPPVALAAFAGAGIASTDPMRTGFAAWKFAKGLYLIPLFMVFDPEIILAGPVYAVAWNVVTAFAAALEGFIITRMYLLSRFVAAAKTVAIFWPNFWIELVGLLAILAVLAVNFTKRQREQTALSAEAA